MECNRLSTCFPFFFATLFHYISFPVIFSFICLSYLIFLSFSFTYLSTYLSSFTVTLVVSFCSPSFALTECYFLLHSLIPSFPCISVISIFLFICVARFLAFFKFLSFYIQSFLLLSFFCLLLLFTLSLIVTFILFLSLLLLSFYPRFRWMAEGSTWTAAAR
jgi:hypothetical protein